MQRDVVAKGLVNFLVHLGKAVADAGDVMIVVCGPLFADADQCCRLAGLVSAVTYSPQVFNMTRVKFMNPGDATASELNLPVEVRIASRPCRISPHFMAIDDQSSDEFVLELTNMFASMQLYTATHDVILTDGTLRMSRIDALVHHGCLWKDGMKNPLTFKKDDTQSKSHKIKSQLAKLSTIDPLSSEATAAMQHGKASSQQAGGSKRKRGSHKCGLV